MKKGFTLIELLAVIVILAIISLIATPIVISIINASQEQSLKSSAELYADGLTKQIASKNMISEFNPSSCTITNGNVSCDGENIVYETTGRKPTSGSISLNNGKITSYSLCIADYRVTKNNNGITTEKDLTCSSAETFGGTFASAAPTDTHKGILYLDPTDLSAACNAALASANVDSATNLPTGITSGCMKFYIYDDSGDNYKMILDHNTSGDVYWNSTGTNAVIEGAAIRLTEDTTGWVGNPRLITANEVAHIIGTDSADKLKWNQSKTYGDDDINNKISWFYFDNEGNTYAQWQIEVVSSTTKSKYSWLYDYTHECESHGCLVQDNNIYSYPTKASTTKSNVYGYWTSTPVVGYTIYAWGVNRDNCLYDRLVNDDRGRYGIRPVIELPKSILN